MCSFAFTTARSYSCREGSRLVEPDAVPLPAACSGSAPCRSDVTSAGSPARTSAIPSAWSKRTSVSATTKRLSGRSRPSSGSGTVGSSTAAWS